MKHNQQPRYILVAVIWLISNGNECVRVVSNEKWLSAIRGLQPGRGALTLQLGTESWNNFIEGPSDVYTRPSLIEIMVRHLIGTKPLSQPIMDYFPLSRWHRISMKLASK